MLYLHTRRLSRQAIIGALVVVVTFGGLSTAAWADSTPSPTDPAADASAPTPSTSVTATASATDEPKPSASAEPAETDDASSTSTPRVTASAEPTRVGTSKVTAGKAVAPAAIPNPPANSSVVNVKLGGNRTGITGVTGLAGVSMGLYTTAAATTASYTCTSDADGDCNFIVPNTQQGGANRNARFYIKAISAPSGWRLNQTLRTGDGDGGNSQSTAYQFQTPQLQSGQTYTSTEDFMVGSGNSNRAASGGVWQLSRTNPTLPTSCGLDVALILDLSSSVGSQVTALRGAADTLVNALQGTPSRMSLFSFSTGSPAVNASQNYPALTSVATAAQGTAFKARYASWTASGGTNWDVGLAAVANANDVPDMAIIITDGNPTFYGNPAAGPAASPACVRSRTASSRPTRFAARAPA